MYVLLEVSRAQRQGKESVPGSLKGGLGQYSQGNILYAAFSLNLLVEVKYEKAFS